MSTLNLGKIRFNWAGAYNNSTAYVANDVVSSSGNSYICILASTGNAVSNATYWSIMSSAGTNGTNGTDLGTVLTTQGDVAYRDGSGLQRLAKGTASQQLAMNSGATAPEWITSSAGLTLKGSPVSTSSGTNIDVSGFPAGISMLVVGFMGISCVSTVDMVFQMGTASGLLAGSGYNWSASAELVDSQAIDVIDNTAGFPINAHWHGHEFLYDGQMIVTRMSSSHAWTASWTVSTSKSSYFQLSTGAGKIANLGGEFTQIRLRNGGHAFDAGEVNFAYLL